MTPLKYFLFDIGNVLVDFDFQMLLDRMAADSGRPVGPADETDLEMHDAVEKGLITDQEFVDYLNRTKGLSWSLDDYTGIWCGMFSVNPAGRELFLEALRRDLPVYTLSNIAAHHMEAIERNEPGFFDGAAGLFLSYRMGVRKPDPEIYRQTLDELGVDGSRCFFIDDRPENIEAARAAGIQAHQFIPEAYPAVHVAAAGFFDFNFTPPR
jgi:glucose-1-phosphatase